MPDWLAWQRHPTKSSASPHGHRLGLGGQRSCWAASSPLWTEGSQHIPSVQDELSLDERPLLQALLPITSPSRGGPCPCPEELLCCPMDKPWPGYPFLEGSGDGGLGPRMQGGTPAQWLCVGSGPQAALEGGGIQPAAHGAPTALARGGLRGCPHPARGLCAAPGWGCVCPAATGARAEPAEPRGAPTRESGRPRSAPGIIAPSAPGLHPLCPPGVGVGPGPGAGVGPGPGSALPVPRPSQSPFRAAAPPRSVPSPSPSPPVALPAPRGSAQHGRSAQRPGPSPSAGPGPPLRAPPLRARPGPRIKGAPRPLARPRPPLRSVPLRVAARPPAGLPGHG